MKEQNDYNNCIQCIWFCVNANKIDQRELNALTELKNNINNIPLIIVFTKSIVKSKIDDMKKQLKDKFNDCKFIPVLARETQHIKETINLDELLEMTFESIKSNDKSEFFDKVRNVYRQKEENRLNEKISKIESNIINKLVEEFITNYTKVLSPEGFELYIYHLIEKVIKAFSFKKEINAETKFLIQNTKNKIRKMIQLYIEFYSQNAKNYINTIKDTKSLLYLEMQVEIEKIQKTSINNRYKKN